ncbi:MAG: flagellar hook-associated protein FlgK [Acidobacteria bacterium]|nr:flagellar hook-associated protein FlgK [Acidobacteriota bacterium]
MGSINAAFYLITGALEADQSALDIVANNVANANTPGYTREVPNWRENIPVEIAGVSYGTGVTQTGSTSVRDRVLEERLSQQQQAQSGSSARLAALDSVQALFTPASGSSSSRAGDIGSDITGFFNSFASLEANPTDASLRSQVLATARLLAGDISNAATSLNAQATSLDQQVASITSQVNSLTAAVAQLNLQIAGSSPSGDAGSLEDERQLDLAKLSQLIGINQIRTENNGISVTTGSGEMLISEGNSYALSDGAVNGVTHFFVGNRDITAGLSGGGGQVGGLLTARDQDIPKVLGKLDELAYDLSTQVNALNNSGTDLNGNTGSGASPLYIFLEPTTVSGSAEKMSVVMSDPSLVAAAAAGQGTGDNANARALAALGNSLIVSGLTPTAFYSDFVTSLGATVSEVRIENTAQSASVTQLQTVRNALSNVNLNDEAAMMQQFERSFQAASQIFAILNRIMASAINLGVQTSVS